VLFVKDSCCKQSHLSKGNSKQRGPDAQLPSAWEPSLWKWGRKGGEEAEKGNKRGKRRFITGALGDKAERKWGRLLLAPSPGASRPNPRVKRVREEDPKDGKSLYLKGAHATKEDAEVTPESCKRP